MRLKYLIALKACWYLMMKEKKKLSRGKFWFVQFINDLWNQKVGLDLELKMNDEDENLPFILLFGPSSLGG